MAPRPYRKSYEDILRTILPSRDPTTFLQRQVEAKEPTAIWLSTRAHVFTAERILHDSIGARVHSVSRFLSERHFVTMYGDFDDQVLGLGDFGNDVKPLVRKVSSWAAKSAATFHEALDCFLSFDEELRYFPDQIIRRRMKARVLKTIHSTKVTRSIWNSWKAHAKISSRT